jgi:hypothetical protein
MYFISLRRAQGIIYLSVCQVLVICVVPCHLHVLNSDPSVFVFYRSREYWGVMNTNVIMKVSYS